MAMHEFVLDGKTYSCNVEQSANSWTVTVDDQQICLDRISTGLYAFRIDGKRKLAAVVRRNGLCLVEIDSTIFELSEAADNEFTGGAGDHAGEKDKVFAPMPGKVVKILVAVGEHVRERQPLLVVEAMKMENPVFARADGIVKAINCSAGDQVETVSALVELELSDEH